MARLFPLFLISELALHSNHLQADKDHFYGYFVSEVIKQNQWAISGARVRLDGSGTREFKQAFQSYLRGKVQSGTIRDFRFVDSKGDNLIQLADMTAGAIYRAYNPYKLEKEFLRPIRKKIHDLWEFK